MIRTVAISFAFVLPAVCAKETCTLTPFSTDAFNDKKGDLGDTTDIPLAVVGSKFAISGKKLLTTMDSKTWNSVNQAGPVSVYIAGNDLYVLKDDKKVYKADAEWKNIEPSVQSPPDFDVSDMAVHPSGLLFAGKTKKSGNTAESALQLKEKGKDTFTQINFAGPDSKDYELSSVYVSKEDVLLSGKKGAAAKVFHTSAKPLVSATFTPGDKFGKDETVVSDVAWYKNGDDLFAACKSGLFHTAKSDATIFTAATKVTDKSCSDVVGGGKRVAVLQEDKVMLNLDSGKGKWETFKQIKSGVKHLAASGDDLYATSSQVLKLGCSSSVSRFATASSFVVLAVAFMLS